ncbi:integrase core domain-containing protein [Streptomyces sp. NPDC059680]|uniref:integrase core domain-containing protein n=1 Tax=Streptomyces sp. NPDC059680 TaxID=3346904 RepID=UPI0036B3B13A
MLRRPVESKQYRSKACLNACHQAGTRRSMEAVGTSADNTAAEPFFASLKQEILPDRRDWPSERAARLAVFRRLGIYNHQRRHSTISYLAPIAFEQRSTTLAIAARQPVSTIKVEAPPCRVTDPTASRHHPRTTG